MEQQQDSAPGTVSRRQVLAIGAALMGAGTLAACGGDDAADAGAAEGSGATVQLVDVEQGRQLLADTSVTVIDVRTPEEFAAGHLARAELVDFKAADFADRIGAYDRSARYFIYCPSGNRSGQAAALMAQMGFVEVYDLDGGIVAWEAAGAPIEV